jgi:hypothetical protein
MTIEVIRGREGPLGLLSVLVACWRADDQHGRDCEEAADNLSAGSRTETACQSSCVSIGQQR